MRERLIELIYEWETLDHNIKISDYDSDESLARLADHLLANGVIVPPCKVGDTVYSCIGNAYQVCKMDIKTCPTSITIVLSSGLNGQLIVGANDFGKTVFLSREEAEKALEERSGG